MLRYLQKNMIYTISYQSTGKKSFVALLAKQKILAHFFPLETNFNVRHLFLQKKIQPLKVTVE